MRFRSAQGPVDALQEQARVVAELGFGRADFLEVVQMKEMVLGDGSVGVTGLRTSGSRFLGLRFATRAFLLVSREAHAVRHSHRDDTPDAFRCV
jgi:hypothetical protein